MVTARENGVTGTELKDFLKDKGFQEAINLHNVAVRDMDTGQKDYKTFCTEARTFADATSSQTVTIEGRFVTTGLEAVVTVDQATPIPACRYRVSWAGTKQGAANVIP